MEIQLKNLKTMIRDDDYREEMNSISGAILSISGQLHNLRCETAALWRVLKEIAPILPKEAYETISKYGAYKKEFSDTVLREHEKEFPYQAAMIDKRNPLIEPGDKP